MCFQSVPYHWIPGLSSSCQLDISLPPSLPHQGSGLPPLSHGSPPQAKVPDSVNGTAKRRLRGMVKEAFWSPNAWV